MAKTLREHYQYIVFGNIICRYPISGDKKTYCVVGDIASQDGWVSSTLSMKLKMDEIYDAEIYDIADLREYCSINKIPITV